MSGHTPGPLVIVEDEIDGCFNIHRADAQGDLLDITGVAFEEADATLYAAAPDLLEAVKLVTEFFGLPGETSLERFERVAEVFYRETRIMAPGKDAPMDSDQPEPDERRRIYDEWSAARIEKARAAIAKAEGRT